MGPIELERQWQKNPTAVCTNPEVISYRSLVGKLNWIVHQTRPNAMFDVCQMSSKMKNPSVKDVMEANKVLRKLFKGEFVKG